jgi:hypothetical protein
MLRPISNYGKEQTCGINVNTVVRIFESTKMFGHIYFEYFCFFYRLQKELMSLMVRINFQLMFRTLIRDILSASCD